MAKMMSGKKRNSLKIELLVVFAVLISMGFPGGYTIVYGDWLETFMAYAAFIFEIAAMLLSSGDNWLDIQLLNLDKKYSVLYFFTAVIFIESMLVTRYPSLQFITCTRLMVTVFFAIWLQEQFAFERIIELICIAQVLFLVCTLLFTLQYPDMAFERGTKAFLGLNGVKNSCGNAMAFGIIMSVILIRQKIKRKDNCYWWAGICLLQMLLLVSCQATGALVRTICILILLFVFSNVRLPIGWIFISGSILFLFLTLTLMPAFEWIFISFGKDATLTGRIPLWNQIISIMMENNTFTGYGYGMFWRTPEAVIMIQGAFDENKNYFLGNITTGAHNILLEFWLNSGLIGLSTFFLMILYSTRKIMIIPKEPYIFISIIFVDLMINGFTERSLGGNYDYKILSFFVVLALSCRLTDSLGVPLRGHRIRKISENN